MSIFNGNSNDPAHEYNQVFVYGDFINISHEGGNIGRLYWRNRATLSIELIDENGRVTEREEWYFQGYCMFIKTVGDWIAFMENWF